MQKKEKKHKDEFNRSPDTHVYNAYSIFVCQKLKQKFHRYTAENLRMRQKKLLTKKA